MLYVFDRMTDQGRILEQAGTDRGVISKGRGYSPRSGVDWGQQISYSPCSGADWRQQISYSPRSGADKRSSYAIRPAAGRVKVK